MLLSREDATFTSQAFAGIPSLPAESEVHWTDRTASLFSVLEPETMRQWIRGVLPGQMKFQRHVEVGLAHLHRGELSEAELEFKSALEIDRHASGVWMHLGNVYQKGKLEPQAIDCFQRAAELDPASGGIKNNLASLLARTNPVRAAALFEESLQLDPRNPQAHNNYANFLARQGKLAEAVSHYEAALEIQPDFPPAEQNLRVIKAEILAQSSGGKPAP